MVPLGNTIPARSKRSIHCDRVRHPEPSGAGWRKKVARKVNVYTRHIRNTKGQRSGHGVYTTRHNKALNQKGKLHS